jgi:hypothetical protein
MFFHIIGYSNIYYIMIYLIKLKSKVALVCAHRFTIIHSLPQYDKEKYKEMILDAAETVLGFFGFDRSGYSNNKKIRRKNWYEELREQRARDIEAEML